MPLVDKQIRHDRIRMLSLGFHPDEVPVGEPYRITWGSHSEKLDMMGLQLRKPKKPLESSTSDQLASPLSNNNPSPHD